MNTTEWKSVKVGRSFNMKAFHTDMQQRREGEVEDLTLKQFLTEVYGDSYTPEKFYEDLGIDMSKMNVQKFLQTTELNRWLFPEIFRDAVRVGMEYTPFFRNLIIGEEMIGGGLTLTMPMMDLTAIDPNEVRLRDVNEGATIPEGQIIAWSEKSVTLRKKARGLKMTYESLMFTPINLAVIYFEEVGNRLGADLDRELVAVAINGDQADLSQAAPVIGATLAGTLTYMDIARAWIRFKRLGRNSAAMLMSEADAVTVLNMDEFNKSQPANQVSPSGVTLRIATPLPTSQDIYVHQDVPTGKIIFVDNARAFVQLTAMPLLVESEKIVSRQLQGEYVSLISGFANIFKDGRMVLDYTTNLSTNPGPNVTY